MDVCGHSLLSGRKKLMLSAPKFLFVPVSSEVGIGEYMRSKIVADEILRIKRSKKGTVGGYISISKICVYAKVAVECAVILSASSFAPRSCQ